MSWNSIFGAKIDTLINLCIVCRCDESGDVISGVERVTAYSGGQGESEGYLILIFWGGFFQF